MNTDKIKLLTRVHRCSSVARVSCWFPLLAILFSLNIAGSIPDIVLAAGQASRAGWVEAYTSNLTDVDATGNQWWSTAGKIALADGRLLLTPGKWGAGDAYLFTPPRTNPERTRKD
jgi:hypothetical protein